MKLEDSYIDFFSKEISQYPSKELMSKVKELLADYFGIPHETCILTAGGDGGIALINRVFFPTKIGVVVPFFKYYKLLSSLNTKCVVLAKYLFEENCYRFSKSRKVDIIWINIPHSPVSYLPSLDELQNLINYAKIVAVDLAFITYLPKKITKKYIEFLLQLDNVVLVFSPSKDILVPGLRVGIVFPSFSLFSKLVKYSEPFPVSTKALLAIANLFSAKSKIIKQIERRKKEILNFTYILGCKLRELGYKVYSGFLPYLLVESEPDKIAFLWTKFSANNILLELPGKSEFEGLNSNFLRIPIPSKQAFVKMMEVLKNET